nr:PREDICTED: uncharacterized protein LOC109039054 isoform X2 [Bemisia tabaci]XP_018909933.1 PREDICTED: uncharacterized protein LOC109039054 isoform X2 [Bemisia tabaci]XP_018909934.1 PREDICTED: uncharacterized protein LOC109039054 isoform X2 [Bemisia tabaci]XP_018909935.1 PREDICTED: uncharacterized protein LOC109039054 isoform X2 [Bemisia tabaci]
MTAPKHFGKSTSLDMLRRFYHPPVHKNGTRIPKHNSSNYKLFTDIYFTTKTRLAVNQNPFFDKHFASRPVLLLNFTTLETRTWETFVASVRRMFVDAIGDMPYLRSDNPNDESRKFFIDQLEGQARVENAAVEQINAYLLTFHLNAYFNATGLLLLIDDLDAPLRRMLELGMDAEQGPMVEYLNDLVRALVKGNRHVWKTFAVARLPPSHVYRDIDNLKNLTFHFHPEVAVAFGSREEEVRTLQQQFPNQNSSLPEARKTYGGYKVEDTRFGNTFEVFNTASVVRYFETGLDKVYWSADSEVPFASVFKITEVMRFLRSAILGYEVRIVYEEAMTYDKFASLKSALDRAKKSKGDVVVEPVNVHLVVQYLFELGYFTLVSKHKQDIILALPNVEVKNILISHFTAAVADLFGIREDDHEECLDAILGLTGTQESQAKLIGSIADLFARRRPLTTDDLLTPLVATVLNQYLVGPKVEIIVSGEQTPTLSKLVVLRTDEVANEHTGIIIQAAVHGSSREALNRTIAGKDFKAFFEMTKGSKAEGIQSDIVLVGLNFGEKKVSGSFMYSDGSDFKSSDIECDVKSWGESKSAKSKMGLYI